MVIFSLIDLTANVSVDPDNDRFALNLDFGFLISACSGHYKGFTRTAGRRCLQWKGDNDLAVFDFNFHVSASLSHFPVPAGPVNRLSVHSCPQDLAKGAE